MLNKETFQDLPHRILNRSHYDYKEMANIAFCQLCQQLNQPRTHLQWYHDIDAWYDGGNHCHKPNRFKVCILYIIHNVKTVHEFIFYLIIRSPSNNLTLIITPYPLMQLSKFRCRNNFVMDIHIWPYLCFREVVLEGLRSNKW